MKSRILSCLLVLNMLLSLLPAAGLADDDVTVDIVNEIEQIEASAEKAFDEDAAGEPGEDVITNEAEAIEVEAPVLELMPLADVAAGEVLTVDYVYTGEGTLAFNWQKADESLEDPVWADVALPFTAEEGFLYRCIVTDGSLSAVSTEASVRAAQAAAPSEIKTEAAEGSEVKAATEEEGPAEKPDDNDAAEADNTVLGQLFAISDGETEAGEGVADGADEIEIDVEEESESGLILRSAPNFDFQPGEDEPANQDGMHYDEDENEPLDEEVPPPEGEIYGLDGEDEPATKLNLGVPFNAMALDDWMQLYINPNGETGHVEISFSKPGILEFAEQTTQLHAVKKGTTYVIAKSENGLKEKVKVTVKAKPTTYTVVTKKINANIKNGTQILLKGNTGAYCYATELSINKEKTTANYDSNLAANGILKVDENGGKVCFCAHGRHSLSWSINVTISILDEPNKDVMGLKYAKEYGSGYYDVKYGMNSSFTVFVGDYMKVSPVLKSGYGGSGMTTYVLEDEDNRGVISYKSGKVSFKKPGESWLIYQAYNGQRIYFRYKVLEKPSGVVIEPKSESLPLKTMMGARLYIRYKDANGEIIWPGPDYVHISLASSNKKIATVDYKNGQQAYLTGIKAGRAEITIKSMGELKGTCMIDVIPNKIGNDNERCTRAPRPEDYKNGRFTFLVKSVEIVSDRKLKVTYDIVNGTNKSYSSIKGFLPRLFRQSEDNIIANKAVKLKGEFKAGTCKTVAVTFTPNDPELHFKGHNLVEDAGAHGARYFNTVFYS